MNILGTFSNRGIIIAIGGEIDIINSISCV